MRFLADEDFPLASVRILRRAGHDTAAVAERARGAADDDVLDLAFRERRILLTFDRDFGRHALQGLHGGYEGIVVFRLPPARPQDPALILQALLARGDLILERRLTIVDRRRIRQRPLPA